MGLLDWLLRKPAPGPAVTFNPPSDSKPFGVDKPISDCTEEDIQASREALWEAGADLIKGWRYDCGGDYKSTLFELAVDGMEAPTREQLPPRPEGLHYRAAMLPITETQLLLEEEEGAPTKVTVCFLGETKEDLEKKGITRIRSKKTTKKETGKCYFCGFKDVRSKPGSGAANFLASTNKLTRRVVLGEELAADFEQRTRKGGITAQEWIEQVLRPQVLEDALSETKAPKAERGTLG